MSAGKAAQKRTVVFDSDDSSASDNDGDGTKTHGGDALAREMAAAAERERRKNPHAETGRAKAPRTHPLAPPTTSSNAKVAAAAAPYTAKKMRLFDSDSSSDDEAPQKEEKAKEVAPKGKQEKPSSPSSSPSANKVAHVQGLSFRAVKAQGKGSASNEETEKGGEEEEEDDDLHINKAFATRYEEQKRKQELHTLAEKYKGKLGRVAASLNKDEDGESDGEDEDDDDDDDAEEDEDAVLLTRENNLRFAKALLAVRKATVPLPTTTNAATSASLLPKEELLKDRFFPPAEEQIRANTDVFEHYVERKRHGDAGHAAFTLSDEYTRALHATATSEDAVVDSAEGQERDGLRKLRPQNAEEAKLRAAFLKSVEGSADSFEVVRGTKSNKTHSDDDGDENAEEQRRLQAARDEEKRLLEEAFSLGKRNASQQKKKKKAAAEGETENSESSTADNQTSNEAGEEEEEDTDAFLRDFFIQELWRPGTSASKKSKKTKKSSTSVSANTDDGEDATAAEEDTDDDDDENGGSYYDRLAQLAREEEDEAFFNDAEVWEREYQEKKYRHQEAEEAEANGGGDAAHVQTFPRPIGEAATGLLRKPDTSRKDARQRRRERAEAARAQQVEELKRLKHLKRKEIEDQRALIASVAGLTAKGGGGAFADGDAEEEAELAKLKAVWSDKDLDAPFDPAEFDKKMAQLFDDDYYDEKNVDEDEIAYFDEELDKAADDAGDDDGAEAIKSGAAPALFAANSLEDARAMLPASSTEGKKKKKGAKAETFFDDAFGPQHGGDGGSDALTLLYPSEALQELEKERQQLNELMAAAQSGSGEADRESNAELLARLQASLKKKEEEYYQLHRNAAAEGAGGGLPFRYREVEPEDFTLSVEEILALDDRQLNMIAPMNCYAAYLDKESNERDRRRIERRRQKGFREVGSERSSRRYGDVGSTALLNPANITDEEGAAIAENLSKRLRDEGEDPEAPLVKAPRSQSHTPQHRPARGGGGGAFRGADVRGRGRGGGAGRGAGRGFDGGFRGRGGSSPSFRGRGGPRGRGGFRGAH